ncbi:hypothetical protein NHX12_023353 [Muraenolepis orangiensis]|uniref:DDE Tnp4 domain-containing protein n=1 Tax=Muraenolepis orangiensis TaxID=630683 RepID=A0A9Q0EQS8_9TELE|nr:hypothetical protein NHX12_023352 [Muraenolepis orangiensis]KAJ3608823.1 hypothetical protein NHX12_023353 [Muraenolepis orangiensis]
MPSEVGATLVIPPFKRDTRFSREDTEKTQNIARLRILVERAIRRVKEYHIWDTTIPFLSKNGRNMLQTGVSPSRFPWNGWGENHHRQSVFDRVNARLGVSEELQACASDSAVEEEHEQPAEDDREPASDHNYYAQQLRWCSGCCCCRNHQATGS